MIQQEPSTAPLTEAQPNLNNEAAETVKRSRSWYEPIRTWFKNWRLPPPVPSRSTSELDTLADEIHARLKRSSNNVALENPLDHLLQITAATSQELHQSGALSEAHEIRLHERPDPSEPRLDASEDVQAVVDRLPAAQRKVLLLRVNEGLTYKQIAEQLGVSHRIALRDLSRAYSNVRAGLKSN